MSTDSRRQRAPRIIFALLLILGLSVPVTDLVAQDGETPLELDELKLSLIHI